MKLITRAVTIFVLLFAVHPAFAGENPNVIGEEVTYKGKNAMLKGYIAYDSTRRGRLPIVIVIPEWWGNNEYPRMRARMLAELGYLAMAADMYGEGKTADDPEQARALSAPFYKTPMLAKERIETAMAFARKHPRANPKKVAAIGYCFGGAMAMNAALLGSNLSGVVSFHGSLRLAKPKRDSVKAKMLICHGGADTFAPEKDVMAFRKQMAAAGLPYKFIVYQQATHAFTNPAATETGKKFNLPIQYNENADKKAWNDMKRFLDDVFKEEKM